MNYKTDILNFKRKNDTHNHGYGFILNKNFGVKSVQSVIQNSAIIYLFLHSLEQKNFKQPCNNKGIFFAAQFTVFITNKVKHLISTRSSYNR